MNKRLNRLTRVAAACAVSAIGFAAIPNPAAAVVITPGTNPNEPGLYALLNSVYGAGTWTQADSAAATSYVTTQENIVVDFTTRYAADGSTFGIFRNETTFTGLMTTSGSGATPSNVVVTPEMQSDGVGQRFTFGLRNDATGDLFNSDPTKNGDGQYHMLWFSLNSDPTRWILAWEDTTGLGDRDYNDLIIEVAWQRVPAQVPEPATLALLGTACLGAGALVRRRKANPTPA